MKNIWADRTAIDRYRIASAAALPSPQLPPIELQDITQVPTETDVQATLYVQDQIAWGPLRVLFNLARSSV